MNNDLPKAFAQTKDNAVMCTILDAMSEPIFFKDADGVFLGCNKAYAEKILKIPKEEIIGKSLSDFTNQDTEKLLQLHIERDRELLRTGQQVSYESSIPDPNGTVRNYKISKSVIPSASGRNNGIIGIMTDITAEKRHETDMLMERLRLKEMYQKTPAMLHSTDPGGVMVAVSDYWLEAMEYTEEAVIGRPFVRFLTKTSRRKAFETWNSFIKEGTIRNLGLEYVTRSGKLLDIQVSAITEFDETGNFCRVLAVSTDVTQRKHAERLLQQVHKNLEQMVMKRTIELKNTNVQLESEIKQRETLKALLEARNKAIEASIDGIIITDACQHQNPIIYVNPGFSRLTGYGPDEALGSNCSFLQGPESADATRNAIKNAIKQKQPFTGEILNYKKNGEKFWNLLRIHPHFNDEGILVNYVGIQTDITKIKEAEMHLKESEARFSLAINQAPYPIMIHEGSGKILMTNRAWDEQTGHLRGSFSTVDKWLKSAFAIRQETARAIKTSIAKARSTGEVVHQTDIDLVTPKNEERIWDITVCSLDVSEGHSTNTLMTIANDVTPRKKVEFSLLQAHATLEKKVAERTTQLASINQALETEIKERRSAEYAVMELKEAVEQSPASVVITDLKGRIQYVNPAFEKITGYTSKEAMGQHTRILKSGNLPKSFYANLWQTVTAGKDWQGEFENRRKNGQLFWELASISPVKDEQGRIYRFVAVKEDITEQKKREAEIVNANRELAKANKALQDAVQTAEKMAAKAKSANQAKSEFLANISHEIRTPMNAIIGFSDLLSKELTTSIQHRYLNTVRTAGKGLLGLISDLLDLSSIEAGKLRIQMRTVDLRKVTSEIHQIFALPAAQKGIIYTHKIEESIPFLVIADAIRLKQILINLVGNAVKFTDQGGVKLTLKACDKNRSANCFSLVLIIEDSGIGISAGDIERIFEPFEQQSGQIATEYGGTGLGLTITRRLTEFLGGTLRVKSKPGQGSKFIVTFPDIQVEEWLLPVNSNGRSDTGRAEVEDSGMEKRTVSVDLVRLPAEKITVRQETYQALTGDLMNLCLRASQQRDVELVMEFLDRLSAIAEFASFNSAEALIKKFRSAASFFDIKVLSKLESDYRLLISRIQSD